MNTTMRIAFWCYFIGGFMLIGFGLVYLLRGQFMPYHAAVVGAPWSAVPGNYQVLILALMKAIGGAYLAVTLALYLLLLLPFRQGAPWARWAIPLLSVVHSAGGLYAMSHVALHSAVLPPIAAPIAGMVLTLFACALSYAGSLHAAPHTVTSVPAPARPARGG